MPRATFVFELDLNNDGVFEENITSDVISGDIFRGRSEEGDAAEEGTLSITLDNSSGKYTPKNSASPLYPNLTTLVQIRARITSPAVENEFLGYITELRVKPQPNQQTVEIDAVDSTNRLRKALISMRLFQDTPTGIIIQRILDLAEKGEIALNPFFDDALSTYSALSGASLSIETTGQILEYPNGLNVLAANAGSSGVACAVSQETQVGGTYTASAYIRATGEADIAKTLKLRLRDSGGGGAESAVVALSDLWQRLAATGTFSAANRFVDVLTPSAQGTFNFRYGGFHGVPARVAIPRNVQNGRALLSYFGPFRQISMDALEIVRDSELSGLFYFDGGGSAIYEERTRRLQTFTPVATIADTMYRIDYREDAQDRVERVEFNYLKYDIGAPSSIIWVLELSQSRVIPASGTVSIIAPYGALVKDIIKPIANADYRINRNSDGSGADESGTVTFKFIPYGEGSYGELANKAAYDVWIIQYTIRGTPIRPSSDDRVIDYTPVGAPDINNVLSHTYEAQDKSVEVQAWAEFLGNKYVTQREKLSVVLRPRTVALLTQMMTRRISDRVKLQNTTKPYSTKINGDFYVESIRHSIRQAGFLHETIWGVTPVEVNTYWLLGNATYGRLGNTTRLAP